MQWLALVLFTVGLPHWGESSPDGKEALPIPVYPVADASGRHDGAVLVSVAFARNGKVSECHILRSTATRSLDKFTCSFIEKNWHSATFAGTTQKVPISYVLEGSDPWNHDDFPPPPRFFTKGTPRANVIFAVAFDAYGFVRSCSVSDSSGLPDLDAMAMAWIRTHWHHFGYAGETAQLTLHITEVSGRYRLSRDGR